MASYTLLSYMRICGVPFEKIVGHAEGSPSGRLPFLSSTTTSARRTAGGLDACLSFLSSRGAATDLDSSVFAPMTATSSAVRHAVRTHLWPAMDALRWWNSNNYNDTTWHDWTRVHGRFSAFFERRRVSRALRAKFAADLRYLDVTKADHAHAASASSGGTAGLTLTIGEGADEQNQVEFHMYRGAHSVFELLKTSLGDGLFILGGSDRPTSADAFAYAALSAILLGVPNTEHNPLRDTLRTHFPSLVAYMQRMRRKYFVDVVFGTEASLEALASFEPPYAYPGQDSVWSSASGAEDGPEASEEEKRKVETARRTRNAIALGAISLVGYFLMSDILNPTVFALAQRQYGGQGDGDGDEDDAEGAGEDEQ